MGSLILGLRRFIPIVLKTHIDKWITSHELVRKGNVDIKLQKIKVKGSVSSVSLNNFGMLIRH